MEKCYEYLGCTKVDCIMRKLPEDKHCWEVEGTLCSSHGIEFIRKMTDKKIEICKDCIYYNAVNYQKVGQN